MGKSKIQWTDMTWPVVTGCSHAGSPGCDFCYAARMAATRLKHHPRYEGLATFENGKARWTGEVRLNRDVLGQPLRWRKPRMVFICSMSDLFHDDVPEQFIFRVLRVTRDTPNHVYQILTKRPGRMAPVMCEYYARLRAAYGSKAEEPQQNLWLGVSVENQAAADERREYLERCSAAVKYVSYEPALSPVDWTGWEFVSQIISGGESGPGARPSHPDWHRATRDFCQENDIAYFMKQHGAWLHESQFTTDEQRDKGLSSKRRDAGDGYQFIRVGKKRAGHLLDGCEHQEFPRIPSKEAIE